MKKSILLILGMTFLISCVKNVDDDNYQNNNEEFCDYKSEIMLPNGFELTTIGEINFNGNVQTFQFLDKNNGYAMLSNNQGGYVEVFKTIDGGQSWSDLNIGIYQTPISMIFKDENFGIITVHDVTGCPPPNCQNKSVVLKTENGGLDWEEVEYEGLKGILYHPKYDNEGNLYANLTLPVEYKSTLIKSVDDGENWEIFYDSSDLGFTSVTFSFEIFEDKIYVSGKDGKLFVIDSNGQLIKTLAVTESPSESIRNLEIIDEDNLIIVLSGQVIKSTNGGTTWEPIHEKSARMVGFKSADEGLMLLRKNNCPSHEYRVNDVFASTNNGGLSWNEADEITTNLIRRFKISQRMDEGIWYIMMGNELMEIKEI